MLKRLYLLMSLVAVVGMVVAVSNTVAGQKEKQKDKVENKEQKQKQLIVQDETGKQAFMLPQLGSEGGYLGVYLEEVTADRMKDLGLSEERGAIVMKVVAGSPAEKAGLKENDVIVSFNGRRVESVREMQRLLGETPADRNISIEVIRSGNHQTLAATLSKKSQSFALAGPDWNGQVWQGAEGQKRAEEFFRQDQEKLKALPNFGDFAFVNPGNMMLIRGGRLGIGVESLTGQLAEYFGVKEGHGVLITQVDENSPASKAGLKAGDVVIAVDNENIDGVGTLFRTLSKKEEGAVAVKIIRNRTEQTITVNLEKRAPLPARSR